jgi:hypothetical protein
MTTIGLMEGAFFVGRKEIMDFINSTLELRLNKVEDTASGCVACQLLGTKFYYDLARVVIVLVINISFEQIIKATLDRCRHTFLLSTLLL